MTTKTNIVYIGSKPFKKDTVCGTRLVFKQLEPVPVDNDLLQRFLSYPKVWVLESELKVVIERLEAEQEAEQQKRLAAEEAEKKAIKDADLTVEVGGETIDLGKYSSSQLDTFVVAHDLVIEGAKKPLPAYKLRVRDAARALSATENGGE